MKAYARISQSNQEVQLLEIPIPKYNSDEVLIEVKAFGVGIHDRYFIPNEASFPYTIGTEGSGIIKKKGSKVTNFEIGDRVLFTSILQPQGGSWAEYATTNKLNLTKLPDNLSNEKAATIPIAGKTALECIRELNLERNDTLFIAGASGAIGTFVIQLASQMGVKVVGSSSKKNHAYMKSLGLIKAVDYKDPDWIEKINEWSNGGVTATLAIQPGTGVDAINVVKNNGKLITVSGDDTQIKTVRGITVKQMGHHQSTQKKVANLVQSIASGIIKVEIEKEYQFDKALEALAKTETRHARGKLIVKIE